jgi:hypothetical protein
MKEGSVDLERAVIAHDQAPVVPQPADGAFDNRATPIPSQCATVLRRRANAILLVRADQFDPATLQSLSQRIAAVGFVGNHPHRFLQRSAGTMAPSYTDRRKSRLREPDFRRGCGVKVVSQRNTRDERACTRARHGDRPTPDRCLQSVRRPGCCIRSL